MRAISGSPGATPGRSDLERNARSRVQVAAPHRHRQGGPHGRPGWAPLVDRRGTKSIVDPQEAAVRRDPEFASGQIILGTSAIAGVKPQDWLNAAIVSMGCMGVIYSVVLEVVPLFGVHEAVVQTTWRGIGNALANVPMPVPFTQDLPFDTKLRDGPARAARRAPRGPRLPPRWFQSQ